MKNTLHIRRHKASPSIFSGWNFNLAVFAIVLILGISAFVLSPRTAATQEVDKPMPAVESPKKDKTYASLADAMAAATSGDDLANPDAVVKLTANDARPNGYFGSHVAISGDTAIVGAPGLPQGNGGRIPGAAYIFVRNGASWTFQQKLTSPDSPSDNGNAFGDTVAISGNTVVVAAPQHNVPEAYSGGAYVFVRTGTTWALQKKFTNADTPLVKGGQIGYSVAISGDTVLVTAFGFLQFSDDNDFVHVFVRQGTTWTLQATLLTGSDDSFRARLAISGDTAVIGTPNFSGDSGDAAFIYVRCGTTWTQQQKLTPNDGALVHRNFGGSVAISGNTVIVGADQDRLGTNDRIQGSAYIFVSNGTTWTQQQKLTADDGGPSSRFGSSVAILGDTALVGKPSKFVLGVGSTSGTVLAYLRSGTTWALQETISPSDGQPSDEFGSSAAISSDAIIIGARLDDPGSIHTQEGSAYVIDRITAPPPPFSPCETEIEVNITTDQADADISDDVCDVDTGTSGEQCSLRAAIQTANEKDGPDEISFDIQGSGPHTISPGAALPAIAEKVLIDATTQPGYPGTPLVQLSGNGGSAGLTFAAGSGESSVAGLAINRFLTGIAVQTSGIKVERCYIGLGPDGGAAGMRTVQQIGIDIKTAAASNNTIGGAGNLRNVISNNTVGVSISQGASGNKVLGNRIGTGPAATAAIPNQTGILVNGANNSQIGNGTVDNGNTIAGNTQNGIEVIQATGTVIKGNSIGVNAAGDPIGNGGHGISALNSPGITIGGEAANDGNTIGGNGGNGILIETSAAGRSQMWPELGGPIIKGNKIGLLLNGALLKRVGNTIKGVLIRQTSGVQLGGIGAGAGNAIGANAGGGIEIEGDAADLNELFGNIIGGIKDLQGKLLVGGGNGGDGIRMVGGGSGNRIGSAVAGGANTIIENAGNGVSVEASRDAPASGQPTIIEGNNIGLAVDDVAGTILRRGNNLAGLLLKTMRDVKVGGTTAGAGNAIGANARAGVEMTDAERIELVGNVIGGIKNFQGRLLSGGGNSGDGIRMVGRSAANKIGGIVAGAGNTIIENGGNGIMLEPGTGPPTGAKEPTAIEGNNIGVAVDDVAGTILRRGNNLAGVLLKTMRGVKVGGSGSGAGNAIGANVRAGVEMDDAERVELVGNLIGCIKNIQGKILGGGGNGGDGVRARGGFGNKIGGTVAAAANTIVNNGGNGILLETSPNPLSPRRADAAEPTVIQGNNIGVTLDTIAGTLVRMGNSLSGVLIKSIGDVQVGGTGAGAGNAIGANVRAGIEMDNAERVELIGNVIGAIKNIQGRVLGNGGNGGDGIRMIGGGAGNKIGGAIAGAGNTIVSNGGNGILVEPPSGSAAGSAPSAIEGNKVGLALDEISGSLLRLGNSLSGVLIKQIRDVQVGGTAAGAGNSIGANALAGITVEGNNAELTKIVGNVIGGFKNLQGDLVGGGGNDGDGIKISGSPLSRILSNLVAANGGNGISLNQAPQTQVGDVNAGNTVIQNLLDAIKTAQSHQSKAMANYLGVLKKQNGEFVASGNGGNGINSVDSDEMQIGDLNDALANVIAANAKAGVLMDQATELLKMKNNLVGTVLRGLGNRTQPARPEGQEFGNGQAGVRVSNLSARNIIGGAEPHSGNFIANNGGPGVWIDETAGSGNTVDPNVIYGNAGPGIALGDIGHTPNDPTDADVGPNNLQNYPNIVSFAITGGNLIVNYQVDSAPAHSNYGSTGIYVEFFEADASGEGRDFLGSDYYLLSDYNNGAPGTRQKNLGNAAALGFAAGDRLTATATDANGNSSEFTPALAGIAAVSGRVTTPTGLGLRNAVVSITDSLGVRRTATTSSFGFYSFDNLRAGEAYVISVASKRYRFASRSLEITSNLSSVDFVGLE